MSRVTSTIQNILGETKHQAVFDHFKTGCCSCCFIRRERRKTDMDRIYEGHLSLRHPFSFIGNTKNHQACSLGGKYSQSYTKPCSAQGLVKMS